MRKLNWLFGAFLLLGAGLANAGALVVGTAAGAPGTTIGPVAITFAGDGSTVGFQIDVAFNQTLLGVPVLSAQNSSTCTNPSTGIIRVIKLDLGLTPLPGAATNYCNASFPVPGGTPAASYALTPANFATPPNGCSDAGGGTVACTSTPGSVVVGAGNTPPTIAYNPVTGTTINYTTGGTATAIVATPSGGSGSGAAATTTVGACSITGGGAAFPTTNIAQLSFVGNTVTAQNINLPNCVPQAAATNATLTCPESQGGGAAVNRVWPVVCPAAPVVNTPPTIAYNPTTGTTINYTTGGTATAIVATPSGGSGAGAAATTTVGACSITGGGAAFPTTNIAQLSFVGNTVTAQNINLPNCVPQAAATNATLTCPESRGGGAAVNRVWPVVCPAAPIGNTPPSIAYNPTTGTTINYTTGGTATAIVATPSGGSGSGAAATTTVGACTISGGGAAFPTTNIAQLSFVGNTVTAQNINLPNCVPQAAATNATLTCPESQGGGAAVNRVWPVVCPAAPVVNTPPTIAYNPTTGTTINYTTGGTATAIVATPSGGSGTGAAATTTVGACSISGGGAAFPTTNIAQLSFVGNTVTAQNINLPNCVPQAAATNATLTCPESRGGGAAVNRVWPVVCPAAPIGNTPPTIAYNPTTGTTINYTTGGTATAIVATPSGGSGSGAAATTTVGACSISGGGAAFPTTNIAQLSFVGNTVTAQNINLPNCVPQAAATNATLTCPESQGGGAAVNRVWPVVCPAAPVVNTPPTIAYNPTTGTTINYTTGGTATAIVATPSGGSGSGAAATTTVGACSITGGGAAFPTTNIAQLSFVGNTVTAQNINLPNCVPQVAATNATLTCPESRGGGAAVNRVWPVVCPAAPTPIGPSVAYNPAAGAVAGTGGPVDFTGVTGVGSPGTGVITVTPSGGSAAGISTVNNCSYSGAGSASFAGAGAVNLSFTAGTTAAQTINLSCTSQATAVTANLQCTETIAGGATATRFWVVNCPAGSVVATQVAVPTLGEHARLLLVALMLLFGMVTVSARSRD